MDQSKTNNRNKKIQKMKIPQRIIRNFPQVRKVQDATKTIAVRVLKRDSQVGKKKAPAACALARACVRERIADGALIGIGVTWLIKGSIATRYKTSVGVSREITSFDRHQVFAEGSDYKLSKISPSNRLDVPRSGKHSGLRHGTEQTPHKTADIRVIK